MAEAFWRAVLTAELAIAAAIAWPINGAVAGSFWALLALWLGGFVLLQPLLVLLAFTLSRAAARTAPAPLHARTVAMESIALLTAALLMSLRRPPRMAPGGSPSGDARPTRTRRPPVLLVHGILCNGAIWGPLQRRLTAEGFDRLGVMDLQPLLAGIEAHAATLARTLHTMHELSGEPIVIVAHSMGGLVARAALRLSGPGVIGRIVTLGTPHHGTAIACRVPLQPTRQMCPDSLWLQQLNAEQEGSLAVPITTIYSREDTLVAPPSSAEFTGARLIPLDGLGHLDLLASPRALERVLEELRRD